MKGCGAVSRNKPLDALGGTNGFGQGVMKRMSSKSGALEPHPTETHSQWGRPTGLGTCSGAQRRVASTRCTKTGSSYPATPQRLAPGGWEEWETGQVGLIFVADLTDVTRGLKAWGDAVVMGCVCDATTGLGRPVIDATT